MHIHSVKDPAFALAALIIACALIKEVTVAQFFPRFGVFSCISEYSCTDCILDLISIASITNFSFRVTQLITVSMFAPPIA